MCWKHISDFGLSIRILMTKHLRNMFARMRHNTVLLSCANIVDVVNSVPPEPGEQLLCDGSLVGQELALQLQSGSALPSL